MNRHVLQPWSVTIAMVAALFIGGPVAAHAQWNRFDAAKISIQWPGASVQEVELFITAPIEELLQQVEGAMSVESVTRAETASVFVRFRRGDLDMNKVAIALANVESLLPADASQPTLQRGEIESHPILWLVAEIDDNSGARPAETVQIARRQLLTVVGVQSVHVYGLSRPQLEIRVDPDRLAAFEVNVTALVGAIREAIAQSADPSALIDSWFELESDRLSVLPVALHDGHEIRMRDVAELILSVGDAGSRAWLGDRPVVALAVDAVSGSKEERADALTRLLARIEEMQATQPPGVEWSVVRDSPSESADDVLQVEMIGPAGASAQEMVQVSTEVERRLAELSGGESLMVWNEGQHTLSMLIPLTEDAGTIDDAAILMRDRTLPGVWIRVSALSAMIEKPDAHFSNELILTGPDRAQLHAWAEQVARRLNQAEFADVYAEIPEQMPDTVFELDRELMERLGLEMIDVLRTAEAILPGISIDLPGIDRAMILRFGAADARGLASIDISTVRISSDGALIPFMSVADVRLVAGYQQLRRYDGRPMVRLTATIPPDSGLDPGLAARLANIARDELNGPGDYSVIDLAR